MAFMKPEITEQQNGWQVETRDNGTCYVPGDVVSVPAWLALEQEVLPGDDKLDSAVFDALSAELRDYVPALHIEGIQAIRAYFARLSAPGYLDCTEWCAFKTLKEARASLREES